MLGFVGARGCRQIGWRMGERARTKSLAQDGSDLQDVLVKSWQTLGRQLSRLCKFVGQPDGETSVHSRLFHCAHYALHTSTSDPRALKATVI